MTLDRRQMVTAGLGLGAGVAALTSGQRSAQARPLSALHGVSVTEFGVHPNAKRDQSAALQRAIDKTATADTPLHFPAGTYQISDISLRDGSQLIGIPGKSRLLYGSGKSVVSAIGADILRLSGLTFDGNKGPVETGKVDAIVALRGVKRLVIEDCRIENSIVNGISVYKCGGRITDNEVDTAGGVGIYSVDATGLEVSHNFVHDCANNGIQIWRTAKGEDGTIVANNRVENIASKAGGSGQNGNGISVFRAGSVMITNNRVSKCAYSAIRSNAGDNCMITGNSVSELKEVAIFSEFNFEGVIISNNLVANSVAGISVANFADKGGRLAVIQGNLVRNIVGRKGSKDYGYGISVEADTAISGNLVENTKREGIGIGWGRSIREVSATGNIIRDAHIGIGISADFNGGYVMVANNMISGTKEGGIRAMDHNKLLGRDLTRASAESYRNFAIFSNVSV